MGMIRDAAKMFYNYLSLSDKDYQLVKRKIAEDPEIADSSKEIWKDIFIELDRIREEDNATEAE